MVASLSARRSLLDRLANADIGSAAADVAGHRLVDVGIRRMRVCCEKCRSGHDLARLAVAALNDLAIEPRLLDFGPGAVAPIASMVVTSELPMLSIGVTQERVARRRHARCRRRTAPCHSRISCLSCRARRAAPTRSGVSSSTSTFMHLPLTLMVKAMASSLCPAQIDNAIHGCFACPKSGRGRPSCGPHVGISPGQATGSAEYKAESIVRWCRRYFCIARSASKALVSYQSKSIGDTIVLSCGRDSSCILIASNWIRSRRRVLPKCSTWARTSTYCPARWHEEQ